MLGGRSVQIALVYNVQNHLMQTTVKMLIPQRDCAIMLCSFCFWSKEGLELTLMHHDIISFWKYNCNLGCIYTYWSFSFGITWTQFWYKTLYKMLKSRNFILIFLFSIPTLLTKMLHLDFSSLFSHSINLITILSTCVKDMLAFLVDFMYL